MKVLIDAMIASFGATKVLMYAVANAFATLINRFDEAFKPRYTDNFFGTNDAKPTTSVVGLCTETLPKPDAMV